MSALARSSVARLRPALGIVSTAFALRSALGAPAPTDREDAMPPRHQRPVRCRVLHGHRRRMTGLMVGRAGGI